MYDYPFLFSITPPPFPPVPDNDLLAECCHGEVSNGSPLEHQVYHLGVTHIVITLIHTPSIPSIQTEQINMENDFLIYNQSSSKI